MTHPIHQPCSQCGQECVTDSVDVSDLEQLCRDCAAGEIVRLRDQVEAMQMLLMPGEGER
jgi:hypothetical protein